MTALKTMKKTKKLISATLAALLLLSAAALLSSCNFAANGSGQPSGIDQPSGSGQSSESGQPSDSSPYASFRDIPGLTREDIAAVEDLLAQTEYFTYGMAAGTESFINEKGEMGGFTPLVCGWLTELFGVPFVPTTQTWQGLLDGLENGSVDFTGELTPNDMRRQTYLMTDPIALRTVKYFYLESNPTVAEIRGTRLPRYVLQAESTVSDDVMHYAGGTFEPIFAYELEEVYELLLTGEADAFVAENVAESLLDDLGGVYVEDFTPLLYSPVSLSTQNRGLEPIINAVQRAIEEGGGDKYLSLLHDRGHKEYLAYKMHMRLTDAEREFIKNNPVIPYGAEFDNYPKSFYNEHSDSWEGIAFDVLAEVEILTGLQFQIVNDRQTDFHELLEMLRTGEIYILTEALRSPEREGQFLWPDVYFLQDRFVLISEASLPSMHVNKIYTVSVGVAKDSVHEEYFTGWFPEHPNLIVYDSAESAFDALLNDEVDMVFSSYSTLRYLTNYQERPEFNANIIFDNIFESTFGINIEQELLLSIMNKALALVDTATISEQWVNKTYDYRLREAAARLPLVLAVVALVSLVAVLIAILLVRSYFAGKKLEQVVEDRTGELAIQTTMLTTLFDSIPDLIWVKDRDQNFTHCNKAFLEFFDVGIEHFLGQKAPDGIGVARKALEWYNEKERETLLSGQMSTFEMNLPAADGSRPIHETTNVPLIYDGEIIGTISIGRDITERKKNEEVVFRSYMYAGQLSDAISKITNSTSLFEESLKSAADTIASEAVHALNTHRVGVWEIMGEQEALRCISCYDAVSGDFIEQEDFDLSNRDAYRGKIETERLIAVSDMKAEGCEIQQGGYGENLCAMLDAPIRIDGKAIGVVCVEQDKCREYPEKRDWLIEEQDFASSLADLMALAILGFERRKARDEAQIANMAKSIFLANMSHEIRTPMNVILGITEILMLDDNLPQDIDEGLCRINNSCNTLLGIVNDILDFSKIEAGRMDIVPAEYMLASVINDAIQLNMMRHDNDNIEFELQVDENLPEKLIGDELRIKQIMNNLLSNAFKYTESGAITLSVSFETIDGSVEAAGGSAEAAGAGAEAADAGAEAVDGGVAAAGARAEHPGSILLVLGVRDTGYGMTQEQLDNLFQEYSSFNRVQGRTIEGTGLGLSITRRLAHLMDGEIFVQSEYGAGSLFLVQLRQLTVDDKVLGKEVVENLCNFRTNYTSFRKKTQILREPMPYGRVLVVDDMESNLYVAIGLMRPYGLRLDTAQSGREAIDKIKSGEVYDVIFMDHMMPDMDGIEAAKLIRASGYDAPIVALTANVVAGQQGVYLKNGFNDFVSKPIDLRQLNAVLNKLVRDKQPPEVIKEARMQEGSQRTAKLFSNKQVAGLDISKGLERYGNDEETYLSILFTYTKSVREVLAKLKTFEEDNIGDYKIYVHGVKGSSYDIFAEEIGDSAKELEMAATEGDVAFIRENNPMFLDVLQKLVDDIDDLMRIIDEENPKPEKEFPDIDELFRLLAACKTYKMKDIDEVMAKIMKFKYTEDDGLIDRLKESYAKMNFPQMVEILTEWRP